MLATPMTRLTTTDGGSSDNHLWSSNSWSMLERFAGTDTVEVGTCFRTIDERIFLNRVHEQGDLLQKAWRRYYTSAWVKPNVSPSLAPSGLQVERLKYHAVLNTWYTSSVN